LTGGGEERRGEEEMRMDDGARRYCGKTWVLLSVLLVIGGGMIQQCTVY
jgi:hypothetical protein